MISVGVSLGRPRDGVRPFGIYGGRHSPPVPHRWLLGWGWVTEDDACRDETLDYGESVWDRFCVYIARDFKPTIHLFRGRRRPFTG